MKQIGLLTVMVLAILLVGGCKKGEDRSVEAEHASPGNAVEKVPEIKATIEKTVPVVEEDAAYVVEEDAIYAAQEEVRAAQMAEALPEEALAASFHGQIERVLNDLYTSAEEVEQKVAYFSDDEVLSYADEYKSVILYVKDKITALSGDLGQLDVADMTGEEARKIRQQLAQAIEQLNILKERYVIYLNRLEKMGVNMRDYGF